MNLVKKQLKLSSTHELKNGTELHRFLELVQEKDLRAWGRKEEERPLRKDDTGPAEPWGKFVRGLVLGLIP